MTVVLAVIAILAVANPIVQGVLTAIQVGVTTDQSNRKGIEVPGNWVALGIGGRCDLVDGISARVGLNYRQGHLRRASLRDAKGTLAAV